MSGLIATNELTDMINHLQEANIIQEVIPSIGDIGRYTASIVGLSAAAGTVEALVNRGREQVGWVENAINPTTGAKIFLAYAFIAPYVQYANNCKELIVEAGLATGAVLLFENVRKAFRVGVPYSVRVGIPYLARKAKTKINDWRSSRYGSQITDFHGGELGAESQ